MKYLYIFFFKPLFDRVFALVILFTLSPIIILVLVILMLVNRGSPFFIQTRPGKLSQPFNLVKFKTMNDKRDEYNNLLSDDLRLTGIGKFVRKISLDEVPQLFNVLSGQMSLIGPRPLLMEYLPLYSPFQMRRHEVKPGITGWAQVNGRNSISWQQKFAYDVWYVDNMSFALDLRIFFRTLVKVFKAEGISAAGVATVEKFTGNN
jgi:undecaprenyl phosphate N,N'-diacetylbacillosamine 1-phosphate transferase